MNSLLVAGLLLVPRIEAANIHSFSVQVDSAAVVHGETTLASVLVKAKVEGLTECTKGFAHVVLTLQEGEEGKSQVVANIVHPPGRIGIVCHDNTPVLVPVQETFVLPVSALANTFVANVAPTVADLSLENMWEQTSCGPDTDFIIPALASGHFGHGPVLPNVCRFNFTGE